MVVIRLNIETFINNISLYKIKMGEIDKHIKEEIKQHIGYNQPGEHKKKKVRIIRDKKQYSIRIPKLMAEALNINEDKDHFEFSLIPNEDKETKFILKGILVKG